MSEEPVIGADSEQDSDPGEPVIGADAAEAPPVDATESDLAEMLRETLLAAHDDLDADDLAGETVSAVRERYVAARARLQREAAEAREAAVPAGAPGRLSPAPATAFEKIREGLTRLHA